MSKSSSDVPGGAAPVIAEGGGGAKDQQHVVLIAEDIPMLKKMLVRHFEKRLQCQVLQASTGEEALELFRQHAGEIDCVFMDVKMPEKDGNVATARIRAHEKALRGHVPVPILRLSSDQSPADIQAS